MPRLLKEWWARRELTTQSSPPVKDSDVNYLVDTGPLVAMLNALIFDFTIYRRSDGNPVPCIMPQN